MKKILIFILGIFLLSACCKSDRIDHQDNKYIYVWQYNGNDSTLVKFKRPIYSEHKVMGGHHKNHHIFVDYNNNGYYSCCSLPYDVDRCTIVKMAQDAEIIKRPLTGIFYEEFYPRHELYFIRYK